MRKWSSESGGGSPARGNHVWSSSASGISSIKRNQNYAAKAAAQRLAQVMVSQANDNDEDEDDLGDEDNNGDFGLRFNPPLPLSLSRPAVKTNRVKNGSGAVKPVVPSPKIGRSSSDVVSHNLSDGVQPARSVSTILTGAMPSVPPSRPSLKTAAPIPLIDRPRNWKKEKTYSKSLPAQICPSQVHKKQMFSPDLGQLNSSDKGDGCAASELRDKLDMLQEENENILEKLQVTKESRDAAEARVRELERQVAALGEGVSLEAKLLSRKEAALCQKEAALEEVKLARDGADLEMTSLQSDIKIAKKEAASVFEQVHATESEVKALRSMTKGMVLTQLQVEEVVIKRCWLARYWGLAAQYGICADIAVLKHEYWSSLAPLPLEIVLSAGMKAKEEYQQKGNNNPLRGKLTEDFNDLMGEGNIERMLAVEMGLKELASLKVEESIILAFIPQRHPNSARTSMPDFKSSIDPKYMEAFELGPEESEDVLFKEAWLTYFWRRAKAYGIEEEIANERLKFWISRTGQSPTSHDAVDVEQGLVELQKFEIERRLWEASRREMDLDAALLIGRKSSA